jgi:hypothetical protein
MMTLDFKKSSSLSNNAPLHRECKYFLNTTPGTVFATLHIQITMKKSLETAFCEGLSNLYQWTGPGLFLHQCRPQGPRASVPRAPDGAPKLHLT